MRLFWVVLGIVLIAALGLAGAYNGFVGREQAAKKAWAQVESQLQRRYDLIPRLVSVVHGYAAHEKGVFALVAEARAAVMQASSIDDKVRAANRLESSLSRLLVVAERYPALAASGNFIALQDELAGTENRLAVARGRYNEKVKDYNTAARSFPNNLLAGLFGFDPEKPFFQLDK